MKNEKSITENNDVSLMYIKNNKGPKMDPCGTPARILTQDEH